MSDTPAKQGIHVLYAVDEFDSENSNVSVRPAFITKVNRDGSVNLVVLPDGPADLQKLGGNMQYPTAPVHKTKVEYSQKLSAGCWSLPTEG